MNELQWMLKLPNSTAVQLGPEVAETLGMDRSTTVGKIRDLIQPAPIEEETMIEIEDDLNMEL